MSDIVCPRLKSPFSWNFATEFERLREGMVLSMVQPLVSPVENPFHQTSVATAHDGENLYVVAEMEDVDIFNLATGMNQRTWMMGDVFEIFLRPDAQEAYYEFHVTPENRIMQLRLKNSEAFYRKSTPEEKKAAFRQNLIAEKLIESRTDISRESDCWRVMVSIPLGRLCERKPWEVSDIWKVSFCRYDYTRGRENPVVSSTSPHEKLDFHNQSFWRRLLFNSKDSLS